MSREPAAISTQLAVRAIGLVSLAALVSLHVQLDGLLGTHGIFPIAPRLDDAHFLELPSILVLTGASDRAMHALLLLGELASIALALGLLPGVAALVAFAVYQSFCVVGWPFLPLQWDTLLCESLVLAAIASPWDRSRVTLSSLPAPHPIARLAFVVLVCRLHVASGLVKILSGDPRWLDLSALDVHFETQPLPTPLSPLVHALPSWMHAAMVLAVYGLEIVLPFAAVVRTARPWVLGGLCVLQVSITLTGNYGFFNVLSLVLALPLLDDEQLARFASRLAARFHVEAMRPSRVAADRAIGALAIGMITLGSLDFVAGVGVQLPEPIADARAAVARAHLTSEYGPFGVMTTVRREIVFEVSDDGQRWQACRFRDKPDTAGRGLAFVPLHLPRLDWMLWFAALGEPEDARWVLLVERRLLEDRQEVRALFSDVPLEHPRFVRAVRYRMRFDPDGEATWVRDEREPFGPTLER